MSAEATAEVTTTKEVEKSDKKEAEAEAKPAAKEEETTKSPRKEEEKPETKEKENENPKSPQPKENGEPEGAAAATKLPTLREQFKAFSKFGDTKSDGKHLTLSQSDKWMKQAKVIDGKTITTTDTAIHFKKFKQMKITFPDYEKYLGELAKSKTMEVATLKNKLRSSGAPGTSGTTAVLKNEAVDRLTDSKKYTGSHKIRVEKGKSTPSPKK